MAKNTGKGSRAAAEQNRRESDYIPSVAEFRVSYRVTHADLDSTESIERADAAFERGIEQVRASERAKRPDREQIYKLVQFAVQETCRKYPMQPGMPGEITQEVCRALSSLALEPEAREVTDADASPE